VTTAAIVVGDRVGAGSGGLILRPEACRARPGSGAGRRSWIPSTCRRA